MSPEHEETPRVPQLAAMLAELGLAASGDDLADGLERTLAPLAGSADAPAPAPSAALLLLMGGTSAPTPRADSPASTAPAPGPAVLPTRVTRTIEAALRPAAPDRSTAATPLLVRGRRALAGALVLAVSGVGATGLSAAAGTLPTPIQRHVSDFSRHYLPFTFPRPSVQPRPESPLSSTGPVHGSGSRPTRDDDGSGDARGASPARAAELPGAHLVRATSTTDSPAARHDRGLQRRDAFDDGGSDRSDRADGSGRGRAAGDGTGRPSHAGPGPEGDGSSHGNGNGQGGSGAAGAEDRPGTHGQKARAAEPRSAQAAGSEDEGPRHQAQRSPQPRSAQPRSAQPRSAQPRSESAEGSGAGMAGGAQDGRGGDGSQAGRGGDDGPGGRGHRASVSLDLPGGTVEVSLGQAAGRQGAGRQGAGRQGAGRQGAGTGG